MSRGDIAFPTHFADEAASRTEHPAHAFNHPIRFSHQCRAAFGNNGIARAKSSMCIHNPGIQAALPCRRGHVGGGVNADDTCASSGNLGAQHPVAAAEIKNAFTGSRIKQGQNLGAECRNLTGMFGVGRQTRVAT